MSTRPSKPPGYRPTWQDRVDPLEWCEVDRALAFAAVALVFRVVNALQASSHLDDPSRPAFLDVAVLGRAVPTLWGLVVWWLLIGLVGLRLRRRRPDSNAYVLVMLTSFWATNALVSIAIGFAQSPFWIVLSGGSVAMMLCFGWRRTFGSLIPGALMMIAAMAATQQGLMRYAPVFARPPYDALGRPEAGWIGAVGGTSIAVAVVTVLAAQIMLGRLRAREEELRLLTRTDPLTELGNRRAFFERFEQELRMNRRRGGALALIVVDVDHFKRVNDLHGHPVGDETLRAVARTLMAAARTTDFVARIGGEEFALLLPDTALTGAEIVAERCRAAIERISLAGAGGEPFAISATFGVASVPKGAAGVVETVLRDADAALYRGKSEGRNRVVVAS